MFLIGKGSEMGLAFFIGRELARGIVLFVAKGKG